MTSLRRLWRCRLVRFWKMSQFSWCRSLKPTARWWFSRTDSSLYMRANSESEHRGTGVWTQLVQISRHVCASVCVNSLVLMRNWLETPGWSTSWIAAANRAARISRSVKTAWSDKKGVRRRKWTTQAFPKLIYMLRKAKNASLMVKNMLHMKNMHNLVLLLTTCNLRVPRICVLQKQQKTCTRTRATKTAFPALFTSQTEKCLSCCAAFWKLEPIKMWSTVSICGLTDKCVPK